MQTEQPNPRSTSIDQMATAGILAIMNAEDATVAVAVRRALPDIAEAVEAITRALRAGGRLFYVGAGTSGRLGLLDAVECVPTFSTDPELVQAVIAGGVDALQHAVEGAEDDVAGGKNALRSRQLSATDCVVGIAASGNTPFVIGALEEANQVGATTIAVSCNNPAPILDIARIGIAVEVGPEIITGSTRLKSGTAQKMILNMLSTASMIRLGKVYGNLMVDLKVTNQKLATRARRLVSQIANVTEEQAVQLLAQTDNQVKPAIVMAVHHVPVDQARAMLEEAQGQLGRVIG